MFKVVYNNRLYTYRYFLIKKPLITEKLLKS